MSSPLFLARRLEWATRTVAVMAVILLSQPTCFSGEPWLFGLAKMEITPTEPLRLSGYGSRVEPHQGVADPLHVRALAIRSAQDQLQVLVSVDTIGFPAVLSDAIHQAVAERHSLARSDIVFCGTHSHTTPQLAGALPNLLAKPLTDDERAATERYTQFVQQQTVAAIDQAVAALAPGRLRFGTGTAGFAQHRRVIREGQWSGFGTDNRGPVDHSVPVLRIDDLEGRVRGVVFNYACHCTTLGPDFNRISGDWAGYAAAALEASHEGAIALSTIGCGADANPDPRGQLEMAQVHGRVLAQAVAQVLKGDLREITATPTTAFGYAGLPIERRDIASFRQLIESPVPQVRRHAESMLAVHERMGRLPESYPAPVQTWRFGDQLAMAFLGGEVVSEYALRLAKEIPTDGVWVTAYANDVFGYVASERMRAEGGYEVDGSMIYYGHPGRWASGTEEVLIRRVHELLEGDAGGPLGPDQALRSFNLPPGYRIEMVAAEPLIADPVNLAFDPDGSLWVVEMGDYPLGTDGAGGAGGRIRHLRDEDRDGVYDAAITFLDGLNFPSGALPTRSGLLVSAAPEIFLARDSDGDGRADQREVLFSGFAEANPQHRVNGFAIGLDGWVYVAGGADNGEVTAHRRGETISVGRRDFRFHAEQGTLQVLSGESQYGRARDAWGNWFGNTNSRPGYQYVLEDHHLQRNPHVALAEPLADLFEPAHAPPVFPASRTEDRFNDLSNANRFTSACSPAVYHPLGLPATEPTDEAWMLVCEPVHNLVHRQRIMRQGTTFVGERLAEDANSEFIASSDGWSRPVRVAVGPDGAVWVIDMYRLVIEHPQWIPEHWQARLNLRAGEERGRIYRVFRDQSPGPLPDLTKLTAAELVERLHGPVTTMRDLASQQLVARFGKDEEAISEIRRVMRSAPRPEARVQAIGLLDACGQLSTDDLQQSLRDEHPDVLRFTLKLIDRQETAGDAIFAGVCEAAAHEDAGVRFDAALALSRFNTPAVAEQLVALLRSGDDRWCEAAVLTSAVPHAGAMLRHIAKEPSAFESRPTLYRDLFATAMATDAEATLAWVVSLAEPSPSASHLVWNETAAAAVLEYLHKQQQSREGAKANAVESGDVRRPEALKKWLRQVFLRAEQTLHDEAASLDRRVRAVGLISRAEAFLPDSSRQLSDLLTPAQPYEVQSAVISGAVASGSDSALSRLLDQVDQVSPRVRGEILVGLSSHRRGVRLIAERIEAGELAAAELDGSVRDALLTVPDAELQQRIAAAFEAVAPAAERSEVIREFEAIDPKAGSVKRGEEVFTKNCAICHRSDQQSPAIGPHLEGLTDRSTRGLLTAVLDPSAAIEARYRQYRILTADGRLRSGVIVSETSASVVLGKADGTTESLLRADIEQISAAPQSLMPNGFEQNISREQLTDLLAYLQQPAR